MQRPFDARRALRYVRLAIYAACAVWIVWGTRGLRLVEVPEGQTALYAFAPGQKVLAADVDETTTLAAGDAVMFFRTRDRIAFGRVVALPGDRLEHDLERKRSRLVAQGEQPWYRWPGESPPSSPTGDRLLVLAENPEHRDAGGAVKRAAIVARLVIAMPW